HPAVWWVSNRIRQERECCCDDLAVAICGNRVAYARALAAVEELRPRPRQFALAADGGRLLTRIRRILGKPAPQRTSAHWVLGVLLSVALLASAIGLICANNATGNEPTTNPSSSKRPIPTGPYKIDVRDSLAINVIGKAPDETIKGSYRVESNGAIDLGSLYGRVRVEGLTIEEASEAVYRRTSTVLKDPQVTVTISGFGDSESKTTARRESEQPAATLHQSIAPVAAARDDRPLIRTLAGHAIDAETGQPVQGFIYEEATFDDENPARFHWNGEAIAPGSQRDGAFGIIVKNRPGKPVWARIVAPGYVPQPITEKPIVLGDDTVLDKFEVRMLRGKTLAGRVVDADGKPVPAAGVYLLRNQGRRQVVRDPAVTAPNQQFEMLALTHATTDADGRFKMTGWDAESGRVAVVSGEMNLWVAPIPADAADWTIHLPSPATILCEVDDNRSEYDTFYDLDLVTPGRKGWEMLRAYQFNLQSIDGQLLLPNHTPGEYELWRRRKVAVGDYEGEFRLADIKLRVPAGDVFKIVLKKDSGWPISGQIVGLKDLGLSGAVISVEPPGEVKRGAMTFDAVTCGEDGQFETGRIPPGKYRVHVDAYLPKKPLDPRMFRGGLELPESARLPDFTADVEVSVGDVSPEKLVLELKKGGESRAFRELIQYHEQPHPDVIDQFTAPPWASAESDEKPAVIRTQNTPPDPMSVSASGGSGFEWAVMKARGSNRHLPEELGDRIKKLPHVTAVAGWLIDSTAIDYGLNASVTLLGESPDSLLSKSSTFVSGHFPSSDEHGKVVVGKELASKFSWEVGNSIRLYDTVFEIVGIYESEYKGDNEVIVMLLTDMQEFSKRPHQVDSFAVRVDFPNDRSPEHEAQAAELRKQIAMLGDGIVGSALPVMPNTQRRDEKAAEKPHPTVINQLTAPPSASPSASIQSVGFNFTAQVFDGAVYLPESLADQIRALPHVTAVVGVLSDTILFREYNIENQPVVVVGTSPLLTAIEGWKPTDGRLLNGDDHHCVTFGKDRAASFGVKVGDS
ncbi:MAG TPA: ABC transporter permease, partial [Pirellulales bacterium]|nr:ABC transporter permease [Pirellulales bacterium]